MFKKQFGVLIVHGFTSSLDCVQEIVPPIAALGLPIQMPILRGHSAESPNALFGVTWNDWLADAETALNELLKEAERAIIVGHSMGGLVTLNLAVEQKDKIDSIIVAAAAVQMTSPIAPGNHLQFLAPLASRLVKRWRMPLVYADPTLVQFDTNYLWAPMDSILSLFEFSRMTRNRLEEVDVPTLILQSCNDSIVAPESANIIYNDISTPEDHKRITWYTKTEHEMFRDCEREAIIADISKYIQERISGAQNSYPDSP